MKSVQEQIAFRIVDRQRQIRELEAEVGQLEVVLKTIGELGFDVPKISGILVGRVKPPPRVREEKPVRVEKPKKKRKTGTDTHFACGHPRSAENVVNFKSTGRPTCRACKAAAQAAWYARKSGKKPAQKAVAEPEPEPAPVVGLAKHCSKCGKRTAASEGVCAACDPTGLTKKKALRDQEKREKLERRQALADEFKAAAKPEPTHAAAAAKWQKQCPILDFETGKRCSLMAPHPMPHSASGRTFHTGINPLEFGGSSRPARSIDAHAMRGGEGA